MSGLLVVFLLGINALSVLNSYVGRDVITTLANRDLPGFSRQALLWLLVFAGATLVSVVSRYIEERLGLLWRNWTTRRVLSRYMSHRAYYRISVSGEIEHPDQRITEDIRTFTVTTLSYVLMLLNGSITAIAFAYVLWSISPLLLFVAIAYAAFGSLLTLKLGRRLMRLDFWQLDKEAKFRAALVHLKVNARLVAVAQREGYLSERLMSLLTELTSNAERIIRVNRNVGFFTTGYNWLIQLISLVLVAPLYAHGEVQFGVVTQAAAAFAQLVGAFSLIVTQFQSLSSFAAVVTRVDSLFTAVRPSPEASVEPFINVLDQGDHVRFEEVCIPRANSGGALINKLTLAIKAGQRVLIIGQEEAALSALFRATAGLSTPGTGAIFRPPCGQIMYLSERPYLPLTIQDFLLQPGPIDCDPATVFFTDPGETVASACPLPWFPAGNTHQVLAELDLTALYERLSLLQDEHDWDSRLTLGEQQLLACAHLLLMSPLFAVLDRPNTTLENVTLKKVYGALQARGIGYIAFGGEATHPEHYDTIVELLPDGRWRSRASQPPPDESSGRHA